MNFRRYIPDHAITTIPVLALMFAAHYFLLRDDSVDGGIELVDGAAVYTDYWQRTVPQNEFDIDGEIERLELDDARRDRLIRELLHQGKYQQARTQLLEVAAAAVSQDDQPRLGATLLLLGEVAINQQELASAEIYLQEALYLAMSSDNVMATARSYQLLGQLNISARELARHAANTWDELWQARNSIARGYYRGVNENLQAVIRDNLEIRRYGAAADAWETLASLHEQVHDDGYQAQQARIEAARLFASTGQMTHVRRLVDGLDRSFFSDIDMAEIEREVQGLFEEHQNDLIKTSQARDYEMLYHHYLRNGQVERAWEFRIKSSETLANTSDRSMFQRQGDIIAVLYNSNFAMERAKKYLAQADAIYDDAGVSEMLEQTREMESLIY
jgi:tetratricopeptide (TPR) repeat protein